ncbi:MAG: hypothetical protein GY906_12820 [bacterium]|nr:hypothetical protein [bacterium]
MSDQVTATVRVEFVLEFKAGPWGMDCDLGQVVKQARNDARNAVETFLRSEGTRLTKAGRLLRCTRLGAPTIHMPEEEE